MHTEKCANFSFAVTVGIEICTFFNIRTWRISMDNEAIIRYKFYLCRNFLDKLLSENLITEAQRRKIEKAVVKRIAEG